MDAIKRLQSHSIKPSLQRIAIMSYLIEHRTHPTVDEIYTALAPSIPTLSKTTVYNTLKLMSEQGAAQTLTIDERNTCYDTDTTPHAHFLCKHCGKVYDLPGTSLSKQVEDIDIDGYEVQEIHYYYKGICKHCLEEEHLITIKNN
ncbi:transcriptional repressor [Bacteroides helcogenes]|uniref:Fur family transcriptional regulator n=1 Tax=Bacteroides helcogenes TaxID=290053 RepID=UPI002A916F58|nr:transcriptional repressor [Bacteroides helcogenes]MDY5239672.1 transcriptional repressor [Bacteroides helcogenes]